MALTYGSYLRLDELLDLQTPKSEGPEHDEMLFIVIHQVYELWFKQVLHEADHLVTLFQAGDQVRAQHTLGRILKVLKVMVSQIDVLETMTPLEFLTFRDRLDESSGFESYQFRGLEFMLGLRRKAALVHYPMGTEEREYVEARFGKTGIWEAFLQFLAAKGYPIPADRMERRVDEAIEPSDEVQEILIDIYRDDPETALLCERLVDLDEGFQEWRYRHVKMVQRTIGMKVGTGGSSGVEYLARTLMKPAFPDLWDIRTEF